MGQSIRGFKQGLNEEVADDDIVDTKRDAAAEPEDQSKAS